MQLNDMLTLLAMQLQLDPAELIRYAAEDTIGGFHADPEQAKWPMGSLYGVEGQTLYALVRILKPEHVAEIGSLRGCSTTHLATALSVNGSGHLTAIDINTTSRDMFPQHLEGILTGVGADGLDWLAGQEDESIDLLFEDSSHGPDMCASVAELCKTKLVPGGVLVMHDAGHDFAIVGGGVKIASTVGAEVRSGLDRALGTGYRVYLSEPSDCGVAVAVPNPKRESVSHIHTAYDDNFRMDKIENQRPQEPNDIVPSGQGSSWTDIPARDFEVPINGLESVYEGVGVAPEKPKRKPARKAKAK